MQRLGSLVAAALLAAMIAFSFGVPPAVAQQGDGGDGGDGQAETDPVVPVRVSALNSFIVNNGNESVFAGPNAADVIDGLEFVGFGGFDIDVTATGLTMAWSADPNFDAFEGDFDATFVDVFTFDFDGVAVTAASVTQGVGLDPILRIVDGDVRIEFGVGSAYGDGNSLRLALTFAEAAPGTGSTVGTSDSSDSADTSNQSRSTTQTRRLGMFERPNITLPEDDDPADAAASPPASTAQAGTPTGDQLAATGGNADAGAAAGIALMAVGATVLVTGRRALLRRR